MYENGGTVILHDEEGVNNMHLDVKENSNSRYLSLPNSGSGWGLTGAFTNDVSKEVVKSTKQIAWSKIHKDFMVRSLEKEESQKYAKSSILEGSSIRFDLLGEFGNRLNSEKITATKELFGNYVLVLDNFSAETVRNLRGEPTMADGLRYMGYDEERIKEEINKHLNDIESERQSREMFVRIIIEVAKTNPSITFVMRPHPVMDQGYWKTAMANINNIVVIAGGNVQPWIYGASITIHSGCTTGLEAIAVDTLSVDISNLIPGRIPIIANSLVSYGNKRASSLKQLNNMIRDSVKEKNSKINKLNKDVFEYEEGSSTIQKLQSVFYKNSRLVQNKLIQGIGIDNISDVFGVNYTLALVLGANNLMPVTKKSDAIKVINKALNYKPLKKSRAVTTKEVVKRTNDYIRVFSEIGININRLCLQKVSTNLFLFHKP